MDEIAPVFKKESVNDFVKMMFRIERDIRFKAPAVFSHERAEQLVKALNEAVDDICEFDKEPPVMLDLLVYFMRNSVEGEDFPES